MIFHGFRYAAIYYADIRRRRAPRRASRRRRAAVCRRFVTPRRDAKHIFMPYMIYILLDIDR